jgi:serine phosphatase RsbU (regulator of sigma subunit)
LPSAEAIQDALPACFVLFAPRDTVSGDFYWLHRHPSGSVLVAVVDCTGHGVPGAFMSMIGTVLLDQIVIQEGHDDPAEILTLLHEEVRKALHQDRESGAADDGMDMVLCRLDPNGEMVFAGARNDLLIWSQREGRVTRVRGDKRGIGGRQRRKRGGFTNHVAALEAGDMVYLMTDGLIDQNGADGRRLGLKRLTAIIAEIADEEPAAQKARLEAEQEALLRHQSQRDDITLLGIRIS